MNPPDQREVEVSEEAVELAAEALWNEREFRDPTGDAPDDWYPPGDNPDQEPPREPFLWEQMVSEGKFEGDQEEHRKEAHTALQAAAAVLCAPLEKRVAELEAERDRHIAELAEADVVKQGRAEAKEIIGKQQVRLEKAEAERDQAAQQERERVKELAEAGAEAWSGIEEALDRFGEGGLDEADLTVRLRAAQSCLLTHTAALTTLDEETD